MVKKKKKMNMYQMYILDEDMILILQDGSRESIPAHIALVAARSSWLSEKIRTAKEQRFLEEATSSDPIQVILPDANPTALKLVLSYVYTDKILPTKEGNLSSLCGSVCF